ncbi:triphosphoribosyl-dephospho-CoA synthase MdcB [Methylibium sp.]|uniref:triphosphoribosyl-dephospho-CoA synthase MdcB n=1 Tax=Methylibium sp. TaxID=2067992 RepID=UPI003D0E47D7
MVGETARLPAVLAARLQALGRAATGALYDELALDPKPGLVSFVDTGSHTDMDAGSFMRSLFALRHYFARIAVAGAASAPFAELQALGVAAEARMLRATGGINTHRGAVFTLGLLCAAAGRLMAAGAVLTPQAVRHTLLMHWGDALRERSRHAAASNGQRAARSCGLRPVGEEAALGFPVLFEIALPALRAARSGGLDDRRARLQALFDIMSVLDDTNLAHRGGLAGLRFARQMAREFLHAGGAGRPDGLAHARAIHAAFVSRRLSPGGAADLLAAACLLDRVCAPS